MEKISAVYMCMRMIPMNGMHMNIYIWKTKACKNDDNNHTTLTTK